MTICKTAKVSDYLLSPKFRQSLKYNCRQLSIFPMEQVNRIEITVHVTAIITLQSEKLIQHYIEVITTSYPDIGINKEFGLALDTVLPEVH